MIYAYQVPAWRMFIIAWLLALGMLWPINYVWWLVHYTSMEVRDGRLTSVPGADSGDTDRPSTQSTANEGTE